MHFHVHLPLVVVVILNIIIILICSVESKRDLISLARSFLKGVIPTNEAEHAIISHFTPQSITIPQLRESTSANRALEIIPSLIQFKRTPREFCTVIVSMEHASLILFSIDHAKTIDGQGDSETDKQWDLTFPTFCVGGLESNDENRQGRASSCIEIITREINNSMAF